MKTFFSKLPLQKKIDLFALTAVLIIVIIYMLMPTNKSVGVIYPPELKPGDKIAILSPAGPVDRDIVERAAAVIDSLGYEAVIYPHTFGKNGHFSGTHDERYADMKAAFTDPEIRAILCSRGGYGVVHNLDSLAKLPLKDDPKWVIGFSDISALHALMASNNIASIHASMAKHIALGADDIDNAALFKALQGDFPTYNFTSHKYNKFGKAEGRLMGGNLAVIADLINTPFDVIQPGTILFIEDVSEPIYKTERIIYQLKLSGILEKLNGLIIGQFTEYKPDSVHQTVEEMINDIVKDYDFPIAYNVAIGHVDHNVPVVVSSYATLEVSEQGTTLKLEK